MKPKAIIIHHTAGNAGFDSDNKTHLESLRKWHLKYRKNIPFNPELYKSSLGYWIGYQWYYDKRRGWIQGRAENEEGAHTLGGWNRKSIGVCIQGNYQKEPFLNGPQLKEKIKDIRLRWGNLPVKIHRDLWATKCPGEALRNWVDSFNIKDKFKEDIKLKQVDLLKSIIEKLKKLLQLLKGK